MTRNPEITREWTQIPHGDNDVIVQFYVPVDICDSPSRPAADAPSLRFDTTTLSIPPPRNIWIKTVYHDHALAVIL